MEGDMACRNDFRIKIDPFDIRGIRTGYCNRSLECRRSKTLSLEKRKTMIDFKKKLLRNLESLDSW